MNPVRKFYERQLRRPYVDFALCLLLRRRRMKLPLIDPALLWDGFETATARLTVLPKGDWATPTNDTVVLFKYAATEQPARILELGSYRGFTARGLLEHSARSHLVAVDIAPDHGEAYQGTDVEQRVDRRVGPIGFGILTEDEKASFDLVFVDADHARDAVAHDTDIALEMVAPTGTLMWHDYANWGYFTGDCGVPEVLNDLSERLPIGHLLGSNIAVHMPAWVDDRAEFDRLVSETSQRLKGGPWASESARRYGFT